ncbi:MAG: DUF3592 domain-containing protein [Alistipes sp.]|nr:DUF3592 domain-containing protein [Alistipes sp.]
MDWKRWWRGLLIWAAIGAGVFFVVGLVCAFRIDARFKRDGMETMGVVTRVYSKVETRVRRVSRRVTRREKVTFFYLDYRFSVDGRDYEDSQQIGRAPSDLRKGDSIVVRYLPDDPSRSRLARDGEKNFKVKKVRRRRHGPRPVLPRPESA